MVDFLPDEIIQNVLARLPTKPLIWCRCVSTRWNRLITQPYFMKLRSRRIIILPLDENVLYIDANTPVHDTPNLILKRRYPLENLRVNDIRPRVIATVNGVILLAYPKTLVLYNPFTGVSKKLPHLAHCRDHSHGCVCEYANGYGFGYGETPDDLKIVRFRLRTNIYDVYSFKNCSWSTRSTQYNSSNIRFQHDVGTFSNGFLYWITFKENTLTVLNVKDMVLSKMPLPFSRLRHGWFVMGVMGGCLCLLNQILWDSFAMWVMKEHGVKNPWSIKCSFSLMTVGGWEGIHEPLCILDNGRILLMNGLGQPVIYNTLNNSYITMNISVSGHNFNGLEYVESMFSPSDICSSM